MSRESESERASQTRGYTNHQQRKTWLPYVAPFAIYLAFLLIQTHDNLPRVYPIKIIAVAAALVYFWKCYTELRPNFSWLAVTVGIAAIAIWIAIDPFYPKLGQRTGFDATGRWNFIACRMAGAVLVVPVMEEIFWRAFAIRWLVDKDFKSVPVGTFTWTSFAVTVVFFGLEHHEWLAGMICGALYNWLYYWRKDVFSCIVAHAVSNAALAGWVLAKGDWKFW
jgi:CAAX prenyl protease-like protein